MSSGAEIVDVKAGDILAGKYRVDRVLGAGGMGVVVAAHHLKLDERVAIKFLLPEALGNAEAMARFEREARAAVKIKSEHVARVIDVGTLESGAPYIVMEYLEGSDLSGWIRNRGALPVEQAVEFVLHACEALADAHGIGIIHRDLKPANLFCIRRSDGLLSIKVLDFGISKVTNLSSSGPDMGMTRTAVVMGSPLYMSPEQMRSARDVDARTDIWALGVILYELLTAETPFGGETMTELVLAVATNEPEPLLKRRPGVPPGVEAIILKCLEKNPSKRFQNVAELAMALTPFGPPRARASAERASRILQASGVSTQSLPIGVRTEMVGIVPETQGAWGGTRSPTGWSRRKTSAGLVLLALAGAAVFAWLRLSRDGSQHGGNTASIEPTPPAVFAVPTAAVTASIVATAPPSPAPADSASAAIATASPAPAEAPRASDLASAVAPVPSPPVLGRSGKPNKPPPIHNAPAPASKPFAPAATPAPADPFAQPK